MRASRQLGVFNPPSDMANAGYLGLLDIRKLEWSEELLHELEIPVEKLPRLVNCCTAAGEYRLRLPTPRPGSWHPHCDCGR